MEHMTNGELYPVFMNICRHRLRAKGMGEKNDAITKAINKKWLTLRGETKRAELVAYLKAAPHDKFEKKELKILMPDPEKPKSPVPLKKQKVQKSIVGLFKLLRSPISTTTSWPVMESSAPDAPAPTRIH